VELRQVFLNLVGNSIQAMPNGGDLKVHARVATDWITQRRGVVVSIVDTGTGIKAQDASRIFQPFFSTKSTKGTGLGLWISKGIVHKYNGSIAFKTYRHAEKCVTCFKVFLPGTAQPVGEELGSPPQAQQSLEVQASLN
jgi:signal transduction histidine kinase